jgi:hypothetical protein
VCVGFALAIVSTAMMILAISRDSSVWIVVRLPSSLLLLIPRLRLSGPRFVPFYACLALVSFSTESLYSFFPSSCTSAWISISISILFQ